MINEKAVQAVKTFEYYTGTTLTLHDYIGEIETMLPIDSSLHLEPFCKIIKQNDGEDRCVYCDMQLLKQHAGTFPDGGLKVCHAGAIEYFFPIFSEGQLEAVLFAGLWQCPADLPPELPILGKELYRSCRFQTNFTEKLPPFVIAEMPFVLEALRQLASRLLQLSSHYQLNTADNTIPRKHLIMQLARKYYKRANAAELFAKAMHLSDSRMRHVVRKETGMSLQSIIINLRLARIQLDLLNTNSPVQEIAERNGFGNLSHFFRLFKKRFGISPRQFRLNKKIMSPPANPAENPAAKQ